MENYEVGDVIVHKVVPVAVWSGPVLETRECETDFARPEAHLAYKVIGPEGNEKWVCAYDVRRVTSAAKGPDHR